MSLPGQLRHLCLLLPLVGAGACAASAPESRPDDKPRVQARARGGKVAEEARRLVGQGRNGTPRSSAELVFSAWRSAGLDTRSAPGTARSVRGLFDYARAQGLIHKRRLPQPGDVAFFRDGRGSHQSAPATAAVVERVESDGTVVLVTRARQGVLRLRMNLEHPAARRDPSNGKVWNHYLSGGRGKRRTTAQLFSGFASPPPLGESGLHVAAR